MKLNEAFSDILSEFTETWQCGQSEALRRLLTLGVFFARELNRGRDIVGRDKDEEYRYVIPPEILPKEETCED